MKVVYLYDGTPVLCYLKEDGEYDYPQDEWTEVSPPEGIYQPFYYDGTKWIGSTKEEFEKSLIKEEAAHQPTTSEVMMASTQMQVAESSFQLRDAQKQLAQSMLENAEKDKRIETLEQQQAQILLELTEMKGEK